MGLTLLCPLYAQQADALAPVDPQTPLVCGVRDGDVMSTRDKACYWRAHTFNNSMLLGAGFQGALAQFRKHPLEWNGSANGYAKRVSSRLAQSSAKGTGQFLAGALLHEDPRFYRSGKSGFGPRFWFAFSHSFIARHDNGKEWPALARMSGAVSSGFVGMACAPDSINAADRVWIHVGAAYGGHVASSLWKEFRPDVLNLKSAVLHRHQKP